MSSECGYCMDGADMLGPTVGALAKLGTAMGLSHVFDEDYGEWDYWCIEWSPASATRSASPSDSARCAGGSCHDERQVRA